MRKIWGRKPKKITHQAGEKFQSKFYYIQPWKMGENQWKLNYKFNLYLEFLNLEKLDGVKKDFAFLQTIIGNFLDNTLRPPPAPPSFLLIQIGKTEIGI